MSKPVYLLFLGKGFTEAWHQLSEDERKDLWSKVEEVDKRAGAKWVIICNSRWADEEIFDWGVLEYPDMDAYQKKVEELEKLNWWRYFSAKSILEQRWKNNLSGGCYTTTCNILFITPTIAFTGRSMQTDFYDQVQSLRNTGNPFAIATIERYRSHK